MKLDNKLKAPDTWIKCFYQGKVFVFLVNEHLPYEEFYEHVKKFVYNERVMSAKDGDGLKLMYLDPDGDKLNLDSQTRLDIAIGLSKTLKRSFVHIFCYSQSMKEKSSDPNQKDSKYLEKLADRSISPTHKRKQHKDLSKSSSAPSLEYHPIHNNKHSSHPRRRNSESKIYDRSIENFPRFQHIRYLQKPRNVDHRKLSYEKDQLERLDAKEERYSVPNRYMEYFKPQWDLRYPKYPSTFIPPSQNHFWIENPHSKHRNNPFLPHPPKLSTFLEPIPNYRKLPKKKIQYPPINHKKPAIFLKQEPVSLKTPVPEIVRRRLELENRIRDDIEQFEHIRYRAKSLPPGLLVPALRDFDCYSNYKYMR
ncbi:hypothetical protein HK098_005119 [Nowakowskiella sp. JEL0407]|nr:hypothetical protein HK098_005119 [Nowakowskiella sp. JEL0407]